MKKTFFLTVVILPLVCGWVGCRSSVDTKPRVLVFTDINIDDGDPDDRQSLVHLFWYANEVEIMGIIPDRWEAMGAQACSLALQAYKADFENFNWENRGYPNPSQWQQRIAWDSTKAQKVFETALNAATPQNPLYVLIWGNMLWFEKLMNHYPQKIHSIRLITIGTHLMMEAYNSEIPAHWPKADKPCEQYNWNGFGRNSVFNNAVYKPMWWLEINWTYEGMFTGSEPKQMFDTLQKFGQLGFHMQEVTKNQPWARYFRVGDTPSLLYVIDPNHSLDNPEKGSWAGKFYKPFPNERPNYYTDYSGKVEWNYQNPCLTWQNHVQVRDTAKATLETARPQMYKSLLAKLNTIYKN